MASSTLYLFPPLASRLGKDPGKKWIAEMLDLSASRIRALNMAELGNLIWALAKWGYLPGQHWMVLFYRRCMCVSGCMNSQMLNHFESFIIVHRLVLGQKVEQISSGDFDKTLSSESRWQLGSTVNVVAARSSARPPKDETASLTSLTWGIAMLRIKVSEGNHHY